jgi:hypothetical protein
VGGSLRQTITVTGTGGQPGVLSWQLVGPVPARGYSCAGVDFADAPVLAAGTLPVTGDGRYPLPATVERAAGCYTFSDALTGSTYANNSSVLPGGDPANTALASGAILPATGAVAAAPLAATGAVLVGAGVALLWRTRARRAA